MVEHDVQVGKITRGDKKTEEKTPDIVSLINNVNKND